MKGRAAFALQHTPSMYEQREVTLAERPNLSAVTLSPDAQTYNLLASIPTALWRADVVQRDGRGGSENCGSGNPEPTQHGPGDTLAAASHAAGRADGSRKRKQLASRAGGARKQLATIRIRSIGFQPGEKVTYPGTQDGESTRFTATVLAAPDEYGRVRLQFDDGESGLYSSGQLQRA